MLRVSNLSAGYGRIEVLHGISLEVAQGEVVAIVGANGAGKTTLLKAIAGVQPMTSGHITYAGVDIARLPPHKRVAAGLSLVPEGREVFGPLTVEDNLRLGAYRRGDPGMLARLEALFPILAERRHQRAGSLSGGQQQMLALARALIARPHCLLLDEPSMGLAPMVAKQIFDQLAAWQRTEGLTVLLVEQNVSAALGIADRGYVLETGRVTACGEAKALLEDAAVKRAYLGH